MQQMMQGFNPRSVIDQMRSNPQILNQLNPQKRAMANNVLQMLENKDSEGLNNMATNLFKANGQDFNEYASNLRKQYNI